MQKMHIVNKTNLPEKQKIFTIQQSSYTQFPTVCLHMT